MDGAKLFVPQYGDLRTPSAAGSPKTRLPNLIFPLAMTPVDSDDRASYWIKNRSGFDVHATPPRDVSLQPRPRQPPGRCYLGCAGVPFGAGLRPIHPLEIRRF